jgi:hypothetical protein
LELLGHAIPYRLEILLCRGFSIPCKMLKAFSIVELGIFYVLWPMLNPKEIMLTPRLLVNPDLVWVEFGRVPVASQILLATFVGNREQ